MIELELDLPETILLSGARMDFWQTLSQTDAIWFEPFESAFARDEKTGAITGWKSSLGSSEAEPSDPNKGHGKPGAYQGYHGLQCVDEVNCGMVVREALENASTFTIAVVYVPNAEAPAKTLATVNTGYTVGNKRKVNYVFLSDGGESYTAKDTNGAVELTTPVTSDIGKPRLLVMSLTGDRLAIAEDFNAPVEMKGSDAGMKYPADLFIGCRSHRSGLKKTLGGALILDVILWPGYSLIAPRTPQDTAQYEALKRFYLWEY